MGGQIGDDVGWHVGVSVGNAKILFHPVFATMAAPFVLRMSTRTRITSRTRRCRLHLRRIPFTR